MKLVLTREPKPQDWTFGQLTVNGRYECETLEDKVRQVRGKPVSEWKIKGKTAIPYGTYKLGLYDSPRFGRVVPILIGVDGFSYVLFHWGNYAEDTEGCILVGTGRANKMITNSRPAFNRLFPKIKAAIDKGEEVWLEIR